MSWSFKYVERGRVMTVKRKAKPSLHPQKVNSEIWYYENRGNIEIFVDTKALRGHLANSPSPLRFKIPKHRLQRSLKRMGGA